MKLSRKIQKMSQKNVEDHSIQPTIHAKTYHQTLEEVPLRLNVEKKKN